jgi:hypothetical protein
VSTRSISTSAQLTQQLVQYRELRNEEKELRAKVHELERKSAYFGELRTPFELSKALEDEKARLLVVDVELETLKVRLEDLEGKPPSEVAADELAETLSEIQEKQDQIRIHRDNVAFLEERYAIGQTIDLRNELKLTRQRLDKVTVELAKLKQELYEQWGLRVDMIPNFDSLSKKEIAEYAETYAARPY